MDNNEQAGRNFAWLALAQFFTRLLGAAFYFFLSFKLRETGMGQYSFVSSFVPLWFLITDFGASSFLYREWAKQTTNKEQASRDYSVLFSSTSAIITVVFTAFLITNYFINRDIYLSLVYFFVAMYIAGYVHISDMFLQANNGFRRTAVRQVLEKSTVIIIGGLLLLWQSKVQFVFLAILLSQVVSYGYYFFSGFSMKLKLVWDWARAAELFKKGLPFMFIGLFTSIYARIDTVMLRYMDGFSVVGWYGAAYKFLDMATLFSLLFTASIFPLLSVLYRDREQNRQFSDFFNKALRIIFSSSVLIALVFIFAAPLLFKVFFPASFSPSVLALRILIIAQVLGFLSLLFGNLLIIQNKEKSSLYIILTSALFNIVLNFWLIPKYSFYGAAWATVIAEGLNLYLLQRAVEWTKNPALITKMFLVILVDSGILLVIKYFGMLNNLWLGLLLVAINILVLFVFKLVQKEDVQLFYDPVKKKLDSFWHKISQVLSIEQ